MSTPTPPRPPMMGWIGVAIPVILVVLVGTFIYQSSPSSPQPTGTPTAPSETVQQPAQISGSITVDLARYHVTGDAVFDRSGPDQRATCMWPEYYSSAYQEVIIHKGNGDVTFKGGVQQGSDPGGGVRSVYVKVWPGRPVDVKTQLQPWGSDCGTAPN